MTEKRRKTEHERDQPSGSPGQLDPERARTDQRDDRDRHQEQEDAPEAVDAVAPHRERAHVDRLPVQEHVDEQQDPGTEDQLSAEREFVDLVHVSVPSA